MLQADWLILENNEKATLNINKPYVCVYCIDIKRGQHIGLVNMRDALFQQNGSFLLFLHRGIEI